MARPPFVLVASLCLILVPCLARAEAGDADASAAENPSPPATGFVGYVDRRARELPATHWRAELDFPLSRAAARALYEYTGGNPLHTCAVLNELPASGGWPDALGQHLVLQLLSGDPFDLTSRVRKVLVNGKVAYDESLNAK